MRLLLLLLCLLLISCERGPVRQVANFGAEIKVVIRGDMPDILAGQWDHDNMAIYISWANRNTWTLAHEIAHAADDCGGYDRAIAMVGTIDKSFGLDAQMELARKVQREAKRYNHRYAHWIALYKLYGPASVQHSAIAAEVRAYLKSH